MILCQSGNRASIAKKNLEKLHIAGLSVVSGGMGAYKNAGGITVKGRAHISIERQVRIIAGSIVLSGVLAGFFIHPGFLVISGFVGAGLIFAGITDWCGMGLLLAKMPWNQSTTKAESCSGGTCAANLPGACAASPPKSGGCSAGLPSKK